MIKKSKYKQLVNSKHLNHHVNYEFDSNEEYYFYHWLNELVNIGLVDEITPFRITYDIFDKVDITINNKNKVLIRSKVYTPDFHFRFNNKAEGILFYKDNTILKDSECIDKHQMFYCNNEHNDIVVDIKGGFKSNKLSSSITFPDRQCMMYSRHNIYVQKVIPYSLSNTKTRTLFKSSFTPKKMFNDKIYKIKSKAGKSKIKYNTMTIKQFYEKYYNK